MKAKHPIICAQCGKVAQTYKNDAGTIIVGTDRVMRCPDCSDKVVGRATLCRECCPTAHGTKF